MGSGHTEGALQAHGTPMPSLPGTFHCWGITWANPANGKGECEHSSEPRRMGLPELCAPALAASSMLALTVSERVTPSWCPRLPGAAGAEQLSGSTGVGRWAAPP